MNKKSFRFDPIKFEKFLPDYLGQRIKAMKPRDPQQKEEFAAFAIALADANARAGGGARKNES